MLERVDVALDEQKVRATLYRQESAPRNINTVSALEVLYGSTGGRLKLDDGLAIIGVFGVNDDFQVHPLLIHDALQSLEINPDIVRVEYLEFTDRLELFYVFRWYLSDLQQTDLALVINERSTLDVRLGLVRDLHDELCSGFDHMLENPLIDDGAEVIRVGNEKILLSIGDQLIEDTRVLQGVVEISMTRGVPVLLVVIGTMGAWEESLLEDSWISGLVEGSDAKLLVGILLMIRRVSSWVLNEVMRMRGTSTL